MLTVSECAKKNNLSKIKVKKMCEYLDGARQCPYCKRWEISEKAQPVYVPDKRCYKKVTKKYCYVMDAIDGNMLIYEQFTGINEETCKSYVKELAKHKLLKVKDGREHNYDYKNYYVSLEGCQWSERGTKGKSEMILELLKTVQVLTPIIASTLWNSLAKSSLRFSSFQYE